MIEIKCADSERSVTVYDVGTDSARVYEMCDRDDVIGVAVTEREGETVRLIRCEAPDVALTDALFRAALNAALSEGAVTAVSDTPSVVLHAKQKGYTADFSKQPLEIREFFSKFVCKG